MEERPHVEVLSARDQPGHHSAKEDATPDPKAALPHEEHFTPASTKRLPVSDDVIRPCADDACWDGERCNSTDRVVATAHRDPTSVGEPHPGDNTDCNAQPVRIQNQRTEFEPTASGAGNEGSEKTFGEEHATQASGPCRRPPLRRPYDDAMESLADEDSAELRSLLDALRTVVGASNVITDADQLASFRTDWTRRFVGSPAGVVRPGSTYEAAAVVKIVVSAGHAVVPQGGNTGLVGGCMAERGAIIVSTTRLNVLGDIDRAAMQVSVGAGVTLAAVQEHAAAADLSFPVDLGGRDSATIGGMVATNAGGMSVIRFGMMRAQVVGIEAVLADGSVVRRMTGLLKDNTGFDFASMLVGSEGTLGLVTAVRLRLVPGREAMVSLAIAVPTLGAGLGVVRALQQHGVIIDAAEVIRRQGVELMATHLGRGTPQEFGTEKVLFLNVVTGRDESGGESGLSDRDLRALTDVLSGLRESPDALVATTDRERLSLWDWRERQAEALSARGIPVKLDVSLPLHELDGFEGSIDALVEAVCQGAHVHVFGHIADGNLHVNVLGARDEPEERAIEHAVLGDVIERGGSVSAEHGIGRAKRKWLRQQRGDADVDAMLLIKRAFDPANLLNPGVLFDG